MALIRSVVSTSPRAVWVRCLVTAIKVTAVGPVQRTRLSGPDRQPPDLGLFAPGAGMINGGAVVQGCCQLQAALGYPG